MLRKLWPLWLLLAFVVGITLGGFSIWRARLPEFESFPEWSQHHLETGPHTAEGRPATAEQRVAYQKAREEEEKARREWHVALATWAIAAVTMLLAAGTLVLAIFTYELWKEARSTAQKQARDTRRSLLIAVHSAKASRQVARATTDAVADARRAAAEEEARRSWLERAHISGGGTRVMEQKYNTANGTWYVGPTDKFEIHISNDELWPGALKTIHWGRCD